MTGKQAADASGLSMGSISQLENGDQGVSTENLIALATAYKCQVGELFFDPNSKRYQLWASIAALPADELKRGLKLVNALIDDKVA